MKLVIVESPTKAKTISRFLGKDYLVDASFGHVRDLPEHEIGVDAAHNFQPTYVVPPKAKKTITRLKKEAANADAILFATDEDREGEAIAWHLCQVLGTNAKQTPNPKSKIPNKSQIQNPKFQNTANRITFHEITKEAIEAALKNPRDLDMNMVNAQQARRVLDRLVGYKLSPFLWKKVAKGLSAGRVQSVAVRLICEREREITAFKPQEYWSITAELEKSTSPNPLLGKEGTKGGHPLLTKPALSLVEGERTKGRSPLLSFEAKLHKIGDKTLEKFTLKTKTDVDPLLSSLKSCSYTIAEITSKEVKRNPLPPFTTSTLQQDANRRLYFSAKKTMMLAQDLYEGVELGKEGSVGLITYMRTDSVNLAEKFLNEAGNFIKASYGNNYALSCPRRFQTKSKLAQEAHEAIRPTEVSRTPEEVKPYLNEDQLKLYTLIWQRAVASQMPEAKLQQETVDVLAENPKSEARNPKQIQNSKSQTSTFYLLPPTFYSFRATGSTISFDGFLRVYPMEIKETILPPLKKQENVILKELKPEQHFTEPPARYSDASLVQALEEHGIGRPSTYAPTIATIIDRGYVERIEARRLKPKDIAFVVNDLLTAHFPKIVDLQFTAKMENNLDEIAEGKTPWTPVIAEFYQPFHENLEEKYKEVNKKDIMPEEKSNEVCDKCGAPMIIKTGRYGKFLACSAFPKCKNIKSLKKEVISTGLPCPKCGDKESKESSASQPIGSDPVDSHGQTLKGGSSQGGMIIEKKTRKGRRFWGCNKWPACDYASWTNPAKPTPQQEKTSPTE
jgi:DNA topoisomerase-1